jgi:hypothetical protein
MSAHSSRYPLNPAWPEPNTGRQKADALTKIPSASKHLLCSHDRNLPPTLFRGREIACSKTKRFRCCCRAGQSCRQIKDDLAPSLKRPYTLLIHTLLTSALFPQQEVNRPHVINNRRLGKKVGFFLNSLIYWPGIEYIVKSVRLIMFKHDLI